MDTIRAYRDRDALNYSYIKRIIGASDIDDDELIIAPGERKHITMGQLVDLMLSYPEELINDNLYFYKYEKPSDTIIQIIYNTYNGSGDITDDELLASIDKFGYVGNRSWDNQRKLQEIKAKGEDYINFLFTSKDKLIISEEEYSTARLILSNLKTSDNTKDLILAEGQHQLPLYTTMYDVDCKALPDKLIFTDSTVQPIDFKITSGSLQSWKYVARKFRYDIQSSFYSSVLQASYPFLEVLPFKFIVGSANPNIKPYVYICTDEDLSIGKMGFRRYRTIRYNETDKKTKTVEDILGWLQGLTIYKTLKELNLTDTFDIQGHYNNRTENLNLWL